MANKLLLENVQIGFKNFSGAPTKYDKQGGKRTFVVFLSENQAQDLASQGWNVKWPKEVETETEGYERNPYLQVQIGVGKPPRIVIDPNGDRTMLSVDNSEVIDYMDIESCDVSINPYEWNVNGDTGIKAYLDAIYIIPVQDALSKKYGF